MCDDNQLIADWTKFIRGGFRLADFTPALYHHLTGHCAFIAHFDRPGFWSYYFDQQGNELVAFLNQFGGDTCAAELGGTWWLAEERPGYALNRALCEALAGETFKELLNRLDRLALAHYETIKRETVAARVQEILVEGEIDLDPAQLRWHLEQVFEAQYPYPETGGYLPVDEGVRRALCLESPAEELSVRPQGLFAAHAATQVVTHEAADLNTTTAGATTCRQRLTGREGYSRSEQTTPKTTPQTQHRTKQQGVAHA